MENRVRGYKQFVKEFGFIRKDYPVIPNSRLTSFVFLEQASPTHHISNIHSNTFTHTSCIFHVLSGCSFSLVCGRALEESVFCFSHAGLNNQLSFTNISWFCYCPSTKYLVKIFGRDKKEQQNKASKKYSSLFSFSILFFLCAHIFQTRSVGRNGIQKKEGIFLECVMVHGQ